MIRSTSDSTAEQPAMPYPRPRGLNARRGSSFRSRGFGREDFPSRSSAPVATEHKPGDDEQHLATNPPWDVSKWPDRPTNTIPFHEVYNSGAPTSYIMEFPTCISLEDQRGAEDLTLFGTLEQNPRWEGFYILRCEKCHRQEQGDRSNSNLGFEERWQLAWRHLQGHLPEKFEVLAQGLGTSEKAAMVIRELGVLVLGCDKRLRDINNEALREQSGNGAEKKPGVPAL
ncbi:hypothetical protein B0T16DRAFT_407757 [Cercophora newfieldiana]|uniref:Uncharacterized protein n=1 Tax=Cercophora newfieldiana TaxID=92897 RepID=A0AA40CSU5_9PEZI|nr:hypothetical protein B0T16DRAFT_407757 [Cercophora newfieldiana]